MSSRRRVALAAFFSALAGNAAWAPAWAQGGDPDAARAIVAEHCVACHEVPGFAAANGRTQVGAPPFQKIADAPQTYTAERLHHFLLKPHWPMTQFILSPTDIDNVIALIGQLHQADK